MLPKVIVFGGTGSLGTALVKHFKKNNWEVTSVGTLDNSEANHNIIVSIGDTLEVQGDKVLRQATEILKSTGGEGNKYNAILCVAGGFLMGNAADKDFLKNSDLMLRKSVYSSLVASQLAAKHLKDGGLLLLTGASYPRLYGTPAFIGYGASKATVHHLILSLSAEGSGMPNNSKVVGILPTTIDTPANRQSMSNADISNFTPLDEISELAILYLSITKITIVIKVDNADVICKQS
ncbi:9985_t:CDS:2 [Entrophospora sp. SA101]|nr:9985_t:CDS:2 [Entrophospora sp. SA101]